jgi:hypothetical protein
MKKYLYYLSIFLMVSCTCRYNKETVVEELPKDFLFEVDTLGTFEDKFLYAKEFLVYNDTILIVLNKAHKDGYFVECYDYINKKEVKKLIRYGNGPNEMLSARIHLNDNELYINDYVKSQIAIINMDSLILQKEDYKENVLKHHAYGLPSAVICNGLFVLENPYYFSCEQLGIEQGEHRFITTNGDKAYEYTSSYPYNTRNVVVDGCIITNDTKKLILYASMHNSQVELYDYEFNQLRKFNQLPSLEPNYIIKGSEDSREKEIIFNKTIPFTFLDYTTDKDYIYLVYMGDFLKGNTRMKDYPNWILKFDWDCNLIEKYYINDYVLSVSKSNNGETFYITVPNKEEIPTLLRLKSLKS